MRLTLAFVPCLLAAACGGGGPDHWKDQPLETIQGSFEGHAYSIELPKGMTKSDITKYDDDYSYHAMNHGESYTFAPDVGVNWRDKKETLEEALKSEKAPPLHKEQTADGFIFVTESDSKDKKTYTIESQRYVGEAALRCHARVWEMKKGEEVKDLVPAVEKMCLSLKAK